MKKGMMSTMGGEMHIKSDYYFNHQDRMQGMKDMGMECEPTDAFGAFVPEDKSISNLKRMEESIRERFDLGNKDGDE